MSVVVRRIRADEVLAYREVRLAALADAPSAFASTHAEETRRPMAFWAERVSMGAASDLSAIFVAEDRRGLHGLVGGYRQTVDQPSIELVSMWVAPSGRRRGLGQALVRAVVDWTRTLDLLEVQLWVMTQNHPAIALYDRLGFARDGTYQPLPSDPCKDEVRMRLELAPAG